MGTTIVWKVEALDVKPVEGPLDDVVVTAHWTCSGVNGDYTTSIYSTCSFPAPGEEFTPYDALTEEQVLGWCWANGVNKDATEEAVEAKIQALINPPVVTPPLPWATV